MAPSLMAHTLTQRRVGVDQIRPTNGTSSRRISADKRDRQNMQCQLRIVARIRPLNRQEREHRCQVSVRPILAKSEASGKQANQTSGAPKPSSQRRRRSSPPRLTPSSPNTVPRQFFLSSNAKKHFERKKSQPTSLIAGTENLTRFDFDAVLGPEISQKDVYIQSIRNAVRINTPRGINTTIIAIGHSGSGKSYTMSGGWKTDMTKTSNHIGDTAKFQVGDQDGILPRAIHDLFRASQRLSSTGEVVVTMSFYEVSQEGFRDLLENRPIPAVGTRDVSRIKVESSVKVKALMDRVSKQRSKSTSRQRCHRFCSFQTTCTTSSNNTNNSSGNIVSKLTFVNLAGPGLPNWLDVGPYNKSAPNGKSQKLDDILRMYTASGRSHEGDSPVNNNSVISKKIGDTLKGPCLAIVLACVSPADSTMESTLDILRLTQITKKAEESIPIDTSPPIGPSKEEYTMIYEENQVLKERIAQLSLKQGVEKQDTNEAMLDDGSLSSLQQKMKQVEEAAQKAKESSQSFAAAADRWRSHIRQSRNKPGKEVGEAASGASKLVVQSDRSKSIEPKGASIDQTTGSEPKTKANDKTVQALQEHVNHLAGVCKAQEEKNKRLAHENKELCKKFGEMESQYKAQVEKITTIQDELHAAKKLLSDERLLTEQLEKIRESSKHQALLQSQKITLLSDKLEEALTEKADAEDRCEGNKFILDGERRLRQQAQDLQNEFERNYTTLSSEFNSFKLREMDPTCNEAVQIQGPHTMEESQHKSDAVEETGLANILTDNDSCDSLADVFCDMEDEASENNAEPPQPADSEACLATSTEDLSNSGKTATQKLFLWADQQGDLSTSCSSAASLASFANPKDTEAAEAHGAVISNMDDMTSHVSGSCQTAGFSVESVEHTEFFLPNLSPAGPYEARGEASDASICDLKNILRPWQVNFLASLGIETASEFVEMHTKDEHEHSLARKMRRWRRKQKLPAVKTKSCAIALLIWARTCKAVDRFFLEQMEAGNAHPKRPDFLEVCPSGSRSLSSLGFGSSIVDPKNQMEV